MFIVAEGSNGSGKTTLIKNLEKAGFKTLSSPNGTDLAKMIRPACRGEGKWGDIDKSVQFLLFSAARYDEYIRCVEGVEEVVIADRWWTSTYVYQCMLQGLSVDFMEHTIHKEEKVDLVILLDGDDDILIERMANERIKNPKHGKCTWTKDEEALRNLMRIYREELPVYLTSRGIDHITVDTSDKNETEVFEYVSKIIEEKKND
jgi:thymidylate kinase